MLGEAALATILPQAKQNYGIVDRMTKIVQNTAPNVSRHWRRYGPVTYGPIIRLLSKGPIKYGNPKASLSDPKFTSELSSLLSKYRSTEAGYPTWEQVDQGYRSMIEGLVDAGGKDGQPVQSAEFRGALASVVAGPAIKALGGWAYKKVKGESKLDSEATASSTNLALENAPLRALVGDAALHVFLQPSPGRRSLKDTLLSRCGAFSSPCFHQSSMPVGM